MGTIVIVVGLWLIGGFLAALVFGHFAHRAAVRSPALERALLELTGVRLAGSSTKRVVAAVAAVAAALLLIVGVQGDPSRPKVPAAAPRLLPPNPAPVRTVPKSAAPRRPSAHRSPTTQRQRTMAGTKLAKSSSSAESTPTSLLALRSAASAGYVGVFRSSATTRPARPRHLKAIRQKLEKHRGRAHEHGREK